LTISGSVIDAAGATIDAPNVSAAAADRTQHSYVSTVGKDGRFALRGVLPGKHWLQASFGGPLTPADVRPPARELEVGYASVDVGSGDVSDVAIQLSAARSVRGRIVFEGTRPVPAGELHMTVHSGMPLQLGMLSPHSQPVSEVGDNLGFTLNGFYQLPMIIGMRGLPEGWVIKTIRWGELDITGVATNFGGGSGSDQLEIRLTNRVARPSVRVTDEKGSPVASYSVAIFPTDPARWTSPAAPADSPPSQQGVLALGAIVPGEYFVAALEPEVFRSVMIGEMALADVATVATRVSLREGDSTVLDIKLTRLSGAAK
jgi:hypothetical protein